ncbi:hypothetical protein GF339_06660 [candidate division KSB3 bacterium]|uniref:Uncharacterized protein n=1 Tax=candidate division KSB3 bacterium TaxID=2044937 RepID=A0A9D5JU25_9BACT|nr:hypothetical protein [candidate division KSB3 bacterium]MBD3324248.1 hypothetical protein [candidate division KSB3 bacterium]
MVPLLNIGIDFGAKNIDVKAGINDQTPVTFSFPAVTSPLENFRSKTGAYHRKAILQPFRVMFGFTALKSHFPRHSMTKSVYYAANPPEGATGKALISDHVQGIFWSAVAEALRRLKFKESTVNVNATFGIPSAHYKDEALVNLLEKGMAGAETVEYDTHHPYKCTVVNFTVETQPYAGGVLTQYIRLTNGEYHEDASILKQRIGIGGTGSFTCDATVVEPQDGVLITTADEALPRGGLWSIEEDWRRVLRREYGGIFDDWTRWKLFDLFETATYNKPNDLADLKREVLEEKIPQIIGFFYSVFGNGSDFNKLIFFGRGMLDDTMRNAIFDAYQKTVRDTRGHLELLIVNDDEGREIPDVAVAEGLYKLAIAIWLGSQK